MNGVPNRSKASLECLSTSTTIPNGILMTTEKGANTWPELAAGLYDALTCRKAEITYDF